MEWNLKEKKEVIITSYSKLFDKEVAYAKVNLTESEREHLDNDEEFQDRLSFFLIEEQEKIIEKMRSFVDSPDDKIAFKATVDLGKILYPEFFDGLNPKSELTIKDERIDPEEKARIDKEYGHVLNGEGALEEADE